MVAAKDGRLWLLLALAVATRLEASSKGQRERPPVQVFVFGGESVGCSRLVPAIARASAPAPDRPHPNHDMVTRLEKARGFVERVQELGAFPPGASAHQHLRHFCFPTQLCGPFPSEGEPAYFHTFCLTNEDGTREHCACLTTLLPERYGLHGLLEGKTAARPLSLVVFSRWPLLSIHEAFLRQLWAQRGEHRWALAAGGGLHEAICRYVDALAECAPAVERLLSHGLHLPHSQQLSPALRALRWNPEALACVLIGALTNRKVLVVSSDSALPPALIGCAISLLFPLEYPGVVVPLLPHSLHPDPATLVNDNVAPFLIGVDAELAAEIEPYSDDLTVVNLDSGEVRCPTPDPYEQWLRAPVAERLVSALRAHADSDDELSLGGIRIGCLRFVLDVVDLDDGALPNSAHPADRACAAQWRLAGRLIESLLGEARALERTGAELDEAELERQAQLCRAAYVRELCSSEPVGARSGRDSNLPLLRDAFGSTACSEYMSEPVGSRPRLPEPQWLHWRRLGGQFECSVHEHTAGVLLAEAAIVRALRSRGVALASSPAPAHADDWPSPAPFAAPAVEVVTEFCDAFDTAAVGELVACAPCVLVDGNPASAAALGGTSAALAGASELRGTLVSGRLYLTDSHLCFQSAGELAPRKEAIPLAQVAVLQMREVEGGILARTASGVQLWLTAIHRADALHALVAQLVDARANHGLELGGTPHGRTAVQRTAPAARSPMPYPPPR